MYRLFQYSLVIVLPLLLVMTASARAADIKIHKYDSKGNPIGVEKSTR